MFYANGISEAGCDSVHRRHDPAMLIGEETTTDDSDKNRGTSVPIRAIGSSIFSEETGKAGIFASWFPAVLIDFVTNVAPGG